MLLTALVVYVVAVGAWMLAGLGGARTQHYVGLLADGPACLAALVMAGVTSRLLPRGAVKMAWSCVTAALALYFAGTVIAAGFVAARSRFLPGSPADVFFLAFYPTFFAAVLFFVRARAMRVPWARLALDVVILVVGFGASFWFLAIRPAEVQAEVDFLKQVLSQAYLALNWAPCSRSGCCCGPDSPGADESRCCFWRFTTMTLGDIVWALAKVGGGLPARRSAGRDVRGLVPAVGLAAREQLRRPTPHSCRGGRATLARARPAIRRGPRRVPGARLRGARRGRRTGGGHDPRSPSSSRSW